MPKIQTSQIQNEIIRFGPLHIRAFAGGNVQVITHFVQRVTRVEQLIVPRFGLFFEIERLEVARSTTIGNPMPCSVFREGSRLSELVKDTAQIGTAIRLSAKRSEHACRLNVTLREGWEACPDFPFEWKDVEPLSLRRLHPRSPRQVGELELVYDWSWSIPSWVVARVADLEKPIGAALEEPEVDAGLLENLTFDAFLLGKSIDG